MKVPWVERDDVSPIREEASFLRDKEHWIDNENTNGHVEDIYHGEDNFLDRERNEEYDIEYPDVCFFGVEKELSPKDAFFAVLLLGMCSVSESAHFILARGVFHGNPTKAGRC